MAAGKAAATIPASDLVRVSRASHVKGSLRFDAQRRAASPDLTAALKLLAEDLEQREASLGLRQRQRREADRAKFRLAVEVLGCNLLLSKLLANNAPRGPLPVAVFRSLAHLRTADAMRPDVYGQPFLDALNLMTGASLVVEEQRGFRYAGSGGGPTVLRATRELWARLPAEGVSLAWMRRVAEMEVIALRAAKSKDEHGEVLPLLPGSQEGAERIA